MIDKQFRSTSAIWGDEHKSIAECAERAYDFMQLLKEHNPGLFSHWYEQAMSLKKALEREIEPTLEYFYKRVEKKWDRRFPDLGTQVWLWTGHKEDGYSATVNFSLGKHANNPNLKNACVVNLPYKGEYADYYKESINRKALIHLMQEFWKPDLLLVNGEEVESIQ
ncbi:Imm52 family immunity protein [Sphingobacterium hotanense]|uniref:Imm52 family immunity protein n=1 Tax=Sphingobacterium hotanense TaxID=649196 RepID=UPI0021A84134|nr:Imm52 family immunity protein [Sphingobacterium hotanense]MCT1526443.1 hypothetical protein [Sphingobacterium hotanense]